MISKILSKILVGKNTLLQSECVRKLVDMVDMIQYAAGSGSLVASGQDLAWSSKELLSAHRRRRLT